MLSCLYPKHLAIAGLLLASAASGATTSAYGATPAASGTAPAGSGASAPAAAAVSPTGDLAVTRVACLPAVPDVYAKGNWMVIEVDFVGRTAAKTGIISDVAATISLGWANPGSTPPVDLLLNATVKLVGVFPNKTNSVLFFIPPETLARSAKGQPYDASRIPDYYAVELKIGDTALPLANANFSPKLPNVDSAKNFITTAGSSTNKGLIFTQATVSYYILNQVLSRVSNVMPTYAAPDTGH